MTFGICLFIVLMQFLWRYIDDFVGKGIEISLLLEMFSYAGITLIPMALPLAILLASLMTFGNLGENFELTAIKASGISLLRTMRPVIWIISFIAIGAYFFQDHVMPIAKVKMLTLLASVKQKSPELDIPEGSFYKDIPGYNLYVKKKDLKSGMLHDMMIYDFSKGFENAMVIVADSGRLKMSTDRKFLILKLYHGDSFENLREQQPVKNNKNIAYRRESFDVKEVFIEFDSNFNLMDESLMQGKFIGKNKTELRSFIDSVSVVSDSISATHARNLKEYSYKHLHPKASGIQTSNAAYVANFDDYYASLDLQQRQRIVSGARSQADHIYGEYQFQAVTQQDRINEIRRHKMELNLKYTLSFACLIFLFIGAPLGAIIRKGGLGMPVVISVFLFIFYYIADTFGVKMAKQGIWPVWAGMWLSSIVLFPLGVFLTYKAVNDSIIFNPDTYVHAFEKLFGTRVNRNYAVKEVIMQYPDYRKCLASISTLDNRCREFILHQQTFSYGNYRKLSFDPLELDDIARSLETLIEELCNSDSFQIIGKLMDYPVITIIRNRLAAKKIYRQCCTCFFPLGFIAYLVVRRQRKRQLQNVRQIRKVNEELATMIKNGSWEVEEKALEEIKINQSQ
jgi:lipopolysaccharide export system permease protein